MNPDCIFCKIVRGEVPSASVYEDEKTVAFLDIRPVHPGHTLVISKNHSKNIFDVPAEDWAAISEAARIVASAVEKATSADGVNINMNNREDAGQVVHHIHVHVIPRFKGDGFKLWPQRTYEEGEAQKVGEKIRAALAR